MGASHRKGPIHSRTTVGTKPTLDQLLDFGPEPGEQDLSPEATARLRQVIQKIDEMTARIDRLCSEEDR